MCVAAGRKEAGGVALGAVFDVTGESSAGHVRADPSRLGRALIAMEMTGTFLAGWLHSHPGDGLELTLPSTTDLHQYKDWIRDYSPILLSAIFVEGGWIRFWGEALDSGRIRVQMTENGISKEKNHEQVFEQFQRRGRQQDVLQYFNDNNLMFPRHRGNWEEPLEWASLSVPLVGFIPVSACHTTTRGRK
jgi:proteasome lid subunit RPN8/RPN11